MQDISELFAECRVELENASGPAFELGTDNFLSSRDSEEIKVLFNLTRMSFDNPAVSETKNSLLTSDLRKISAEDLQSVLAATEKAIELPTISLKEIKIDKAKKISRLLLNTDSSHETTIYKLHAKKLKPANTFQRFGSFVVDLTAVLGLTAALAYLAVNYYFKDLLPIFSNIQSSAFYQLIPLISLLLPLFFLASFCYPIFSFVYLKRSLGSQIFGIKLSGKGDTKVKKRQIVNRFLTMPASILVFSFLNIFLKKDALHDYLSGSSFYKREN